MHLLLPHASTLSRALLDAVAAAGLPHLQQLLQSLVEGEREEGDESSRSLPHERVLARLWQWPIEDGLLPFAAQTAQADGLDPFSRDRVASAGWGLLSPTYWHLGTERVALTDPADLALDEAGSRALFDSVAPLFDSDGWRLHWGAPTRWYAVHTSLASLPTASIDRVVGRNVDLWLGNHPQAPGVRRLQAELQMLLHTHPVNAAREAARLAPVNSCWLSGTGVPRQAAPVPGLQCDDSLRRPALAGDAAGWVAAWQALDAGPLHSALAAAELGDDVRLTLCGERCACTWSTPVRGRWQRLFRKPPVVLDMLQAL